MALKLLLQNVQKSWFYTKNYKKRVNSKLCLIKMFHIQFRIFCRTSISEQALQTRRHDSGRWQAKCQCSGFWFLEDCQNKRVQGICGDSSDRISFKLADEKFLSSFQRMQRWVDNQKHSTAVLVKRCSGNMQQIYSRTPIPKFDFNKVPLQLYWNNTLAWVLSCKFASYFHNIFL